MADPITPKTNFLSFDVETNGLHGQAFAVGAVLMRANMEIIDEFSGRCPIEGAVDPWVEKNVLPSIADLPTKYPDGLALREAFWQWYTVVKTQADYTIVNNGYPSEARFLIACQEDDLEKRYNEHPFPLIELNSLLLQVGVKPLALKKKFVEDEIQGQPPLHHHPRWDAWVTALAAIKALKMSGQLKI